MNITNKSSKPTDRTESAIDGQRDKSGIVLPEKPIAVIEPSRNFLNFRELWKYRDLLYILTLKEIKVRYKQTILGVLWVILQPLLMMIVFTLFFGRLAEIPSDGVPYALFAYAGLLPWTFFSNALNNSSNSLVGNSALITKVYFPRMIIPLSVVCAGLFDFLIAFVLLIFLMIFYGVGFSPNFLMLPFLTVLIAVWTMSLGMWTAALNVKFRDVRYALPFFIQLLLFVTPIIYPLNFISEKWRWILMINPLTAIVESFRAAIFGNPFDITLILVSVFIIFAVFLYSIYTFRQLERSFADVI